MQTFKSFVAYCAKNNVFDNYETAMEAYKKHYKREQAKGRDVLFEKSQTYHQLVKAFFRKNGNRYRAYPLHHYDLNDVLAFLSKSHYKGYQAFDCTGCDVTDTIYCKDGVVINYSSYDYIEVLGLRDCDFKKLKNKLNWKD